MMDIGTFLKGLETLDAPNQGMSYHGGGYRRGAPKYDEFSGERLTPRYDAAELNVYSDRAVFLHDLIRGADELRAALLSSQSEASSWKAKAEAAEAEIERLNAALQYEQHRAGRIGTHGPDCSTWGPQHYECALHDLKAAEAKAEERGRALEEVKAWDSLYDALPHSLAMTIRAALASTSEPPVEVQEPTHPVGDIEP